MQFYIIHPAPLRNAALLPEYALKRVNVREGWQILSDIGHRFGVGWVGQNKLYNAHHPLTRSYSNRQALSAFLRHYDACLSAYLLRGMGKRTVWHDAWLGVPLTALLAAVPASPYEEARHYLLTAKADKLTDEDVERIVTMGGE